MSVAVVKKSRAATDLQRVGSSTRQVLGAGGVLESLVLRSEDPTEN